MAVGEAPQDTGSNTHKQVHLAAAYQQIPVMNRAIKMTIIIAVWLFVAGIIYLAYDMGYPKIAVYLSFAGMILAIPSAGAFYIYAGDMKRARANAKEAHKSLHIGVVKDEMSIMPPPPRPKVPEHWAADYAWMLVTKQLQSCSRDEARKANVNDAMWNAAKDYFIKSGLAFEQTVNNKPSFSLRKFSNAADFINRIPDDPPQVVSKITNIDKAAQLTTLATLRQNNK